MRAFEHGSFCWHDLMTPDMAAAKRFYGDLFGWTAEDMHMPRGVYVMFRLGDREVAGGMEITPEWGEVPPHWNSYVAVDDVERALEHARALGGECCFGPEDADDIGRMAGLVDPQGAAFSIWTEKKNPGAARQDPEHGTFCWDELLAADPGRAQPFYEALFRWNGTKQDFPGGPYTVFMRGEDMLAGMLGINPSMGPVPTHWMPYVSVGNCDATMAHAQRLGATPLVPPTDVPGIGRFAVFQDRQGAALSVIRLEG